MLYRKWFGHMQVQYFLGDFTFTVSTTLCTFLLSEYLLQNFQTNDAQLSTMVAEQVLLNICYEQANLWTVLNYVRFITLLLSLPSSISLHVCQIISGYAWKLTGRASPCWHQCSSIISRNNKQTTWELHWYRQVSYVSGLLHFSHSLAWLICYRLAYFQSLYVFSFISHSYYH